MTHSIYVSKPGPSEEEVRQQQEAIAAAEKKAEQEKAIKAVAKAVAIFVKPLVLMLSWNWLMPGLFGLATIGYLKAFAMIIITSILFKNDESDS